MKDGKKKRKKNPNKLLNKKWLDGELSVKEKRELKKLLPGKWDELDDSCLFPEGKPKDLVESHYKQRKESGN